MNKTITIEEWRREVRRFEQRPPLSIRSLNDDRIQKIREANEWLELKT